MFEIGDTVRVRNGTSLSEVLSLSDMDDKLVRIWSLEEIDVRGPRWIPSSMLVLVERKVDRVD